MSVAAPTPTVFISYSHDDTEHKRWVLDLASHLRENGVDVLFDAWDLRPGDDVPKFMERGVRDADRVLMICTEAYSSKANDGVGGVGYEAMIVTGELVRDLGTAKFIPVVRQKTDKPQVPTSVSTRLYINLSDWPQDQSNMQNLLQELHDIRPAKPPLGMYRPVSAPTVQGAAHMAPNSVNVAVASFTDPAFVYSCAFDAARREDLQEWRRVVRNTRSAIAPRLSAWWATYAASLPLEAELVEQTMEGAGAFAPLAAIALAGVASGKPTFQNQTGVLEDILNPAQWQRGGLAIRVELPETGAFLYQALHGAMCLQVNNLPAAMRLAREELLNRKSGTNSPLWQRHDIFALPQALGGSATTAWQVALNLPQRWPWVADVFGDTGDYHAGLYAYYVSLNVLEYAERLREGRSPLLPSLNLFRPHVPPAFEAVDDDTKRRGYRLAVSTGPALRELWASMRIDEGVIRDQWSAWISLQAGLLHQVYPFQHAIGFERLIPDVLRT
jgi:hypothetical protein